MQKRSDQQKAQLFESHYNAAQFKSSGDGLKSDNAAGINADNLSVPGVVKILEGQEQAKLQHLKQHNLNLLNNYAPAAIAIFDRNMRYLSASARWISDFNIQGEVLGQSHYQIFTNLCSACIDYHRRAMAGEIITADNYRFEMPNGEVRWLRLEMGPWREENGEIGGIVIFTEDNTQRKKAELESEVSRAKLQAALSSMHDAVYIANDHGEMIDFNQAFVSFHRFQSKADCPLHFAEYRTELDVFLMNGEPARREQLPVARALTGEAASGVEYTLRSKRTGETWIGHYSFAPIHNSAGQISGAVVNARDITQQRNMEKLIQIKRIQLDEANQHLLVRQTAAAIAHELNQPLAAVANYTSVALHILETDTQNLETLRYALTHAEQQAQRAGKVMHELMALLYKNQSEKEPLDMPAVMAEAVEIALGNCGSCRQPQLIWQIEPALSPVLGNYLQIQKVVVNLIANAIQAMQSIDAAQATLVLSIAGFVEDAALQHFCVSDSGTGLSQKAINEVFQPFYSTKATGLGMGLAISRTIIEAHGGKLWAESNPGAGASFHFTLPVTK
ncbi:PAS domain-containing protein [Methylomonas paludis]|uniref:histidine kinase n=1 Tax=Methylomonas paludis TaxID=1173101 RepID=A0A975MQ88_9GAMM|nr:ATP-binding protein [Methylomonas paludis]QWF72038.1 PAS domain-containing protein [Methylomonas paludis]